MREFWILTGSIVGIGGTLCAIIWGLMWMSAAPERARWSLCDEAIKATLRAPATYRRIEGEGTFVIGYGRFQITYDAANGFGVPLRSKGTCVIDDADRAEWIEYPDPMR